MTDGDDRVHGGEALQWGGWEWREPHHGEHFRRCSYCGSMHPDDLAAEPAWEARWADRKYGWPHKFYVPVPNRDPDRPYPVSTSNHPFPDLIPTDNLTPDQETIMAEHGYGPGSKYRPQYVGFGTHKDHFGKFYTRHLADPAISDETKARIAAVCGLSFHFDDDGRVRWAQAPRNP